MKDNIIGTGFTSFTIKFKPNILILTNDGIFEVGNYTERKETIEYINSNNEIIDLIINTIEEAQFYLLEIKKLKQVNIIAPIEVQNYINDILNVQVSN